MTAIARPGEPLDGPLTLRLFRLGMDTRRIAHVCGEDEATVASLLAAARDEEWATKAQQDQDFEQAAPAAEAM